MRAWAALLLLAAALAGCIGSDEGLDQTQLEPGRGELTTPGPRVVVAVIDTGINLYHEEFGAPGTFGAAVDAAPDQHASASANANLSTVLPVGPASLELSLGQEDWEEAVDTDWETLMEVQPKTLYHVPGTKIIGAISFNEPGDAWPLLLDRPGVYTHGTMTASRAVGTTVSIGGDDPGIGLVLIQGFTPEAVQWAGDQDWIDIVSISAGLSPLTTFPCAPNALDSGAIEAYQNLAHKKPFFASSGNGVGNSGTVGFPSWCRGSSGAPDVISVGANDNERISQWHNQDSYVAADGCANPAAAPDDTGEVTNSGGGTSSATPFSAGGGAALLLEARRVLNDTHVGPRVDTNLTAPEDAWDSGHAGDAQVILAQGEPGLVDKGPLADGIFTLREFKDTLYHTALVTPTVDESDGEACFNTAVPAESVPEEARWPFQGYGEVNHESIHHAVDVLLGQAEMLDRPMADEQYQRAHAMKKTFVEGEPTPPTTVETAEIDGAVAQGPGS